MSEFALDPLPEYESLLESDDKIRSAALSQIGPTVVICDRCVSYLLSHLIAIEKISAQWKSDRGFRTAMAMLSHSFNHLLSAREQVLRGYTSEVFLLLRESLDAVAKAHLFHNERKWADRFLSGNRIWAGDVREAIEEMYENAGRDDSGEQVVGYLQEQYGRLSRLGHSNLDALKNRILDVDPIIFKADRNAALESAVGIRTLRGGNQSLYWVGFGLQEIATQALVSAQIVTTFNKEDREMHRSEMQVLMDQLNRDKIDLQAAAKKLDQC